MKTLSPRQFDKLPKKLRVQLIIEDVLEQMLGAKSVFDINRTGYCRIVKSKGIITQARPALQNKKLQCGGCARAGLFISTIMFRNELTMDDIRYSGFAYRQQGEGFKDATKATKFLQKDFSRKQQALIETAFEGSYFGGYDYSNPEAKAAEEFYHDIRNYWHSTANVETVKGLTFREFLFINICINIIINDGVFRP